METKIFEIKCCEKLKHVDALATLVNDFYGKLSQYERLSETERSVMQTLCDTLSQKENECDQIKDELVAFFKECFFKFWRMKIVKGNYIEEYLIFPYRYIRSNDMLVAVMSNNLNKEACHGIFEMNDKCEPIENFFKANATITMEEVDSDEFLNDSFKHICNIVKYRLERISMNNE